MFGERIRQLRMGLGLTQSQVAGLIDVSGAYLSLLESGNRPPPPRPLVHALAAAVRGNADELWELARHEREVHFLQRVEGVPTSATNPVAANESVDPTDSLTTQIMSDPEFAKRLCRLYSTIRSPEAREGLLTFLDSIVDGLIKEAEQ